VEIIAESEYRFVSARRGVRQPGADPGSGWGPCAGAGGWQLDDTVRPGEPISDACCWVLAVLDGTSVGGGWDWPVNT
jgi:hypothetical protein